LVLQRLCAPDTPALWLLSPTALFVALACGMIIRSLFDLRRPVTIGDFAETGRNALEWLFIAGMACFAWAGLALMVRQGAASQPAQLVRMLVWSMGAAGVSLAVRYGFRSKIANNVRSTYTDEAPQSWAIGSTPPDKVPADTFCMVIGVLLAAGAGALWQAALANPETFGLRWCPG
jgi:hypothetical protein